MRSWNGLTIDLLGLFGSSSEIKFVRKISVWVQEMFWLNRSKLRIEGVVSLSKGR